MEAVHTLMVPICRSPLFDSSEGWSEGFSLATGNGPGAVVGPGVNNPNVFAQQFRVEPTQVFTAIARASSVGQPSARARLQINWLDASGGYISSTIEPFEVTPEECRVVCAATAPAGSAMGVLYVAPDGDDQVVRYLEMGLFSQQATADYGVSAVDGIPRFPANIIHLSEPVTRAQYGNLFRGYDDETIFKEMILVVREHTMVGYDGLLGLLSMVKYCEQARFRGEYVEIGAWRGGCAGLMAQAVMRFGSERRNIHAFDSFQGLPQPIAGKDFDGFVEPMFNITEETAQGKLEPIDHLVASETDLEGLLFDTIGYPRSDLFIHKGWFQHTIPAAAKDMGDIAILRLDGDFYESYTIALEHLYPKVLKGGFIIIDDWALGGCRKAVMEYFEQNRINPYMWSLDCTTRCFQKG